MLPSTSGTPWWAMDLGCTSEDIYEVADNQPPYPLPAVQVMPTQEPGPSSASSTAVPGSQGADGCR